MLEVCARPSGRNLMAARYDCSPPPLPEFSLLYNKPNQCARSDWSISYDCASKPMENSRGLKIII